MGRPAKRQKTDRLHLTALEVQKLIDAATGTRNEARDRCLLLLMFRHGLMRARAVVRRRRVAPTVAGPG